MTMWGILAHSFRTLTFRASKFWWSRPCSQGTGPKIQRIQIGRRWCLFLFGNEVRNTLKATPESFWPHVIVLSPAEKTRDVFEVLSCPGQQRYLDCAAASILPLDQQKRGDFWTLLRLPRKLLRPGIAF